MEFLSTQITLSSSDVALTLRDARPQTLSLFETLNDHQRKQLCEDAWTIGLRAISNAYASAQESRLSDIGKDLMQAFESSMADQLREQQSRVDAALNTFFDPEDGKVYERLKHFIDDKGVLEQKLKEYLEPDRGHIATALARQVGETSPLFKLLSPTESEGLVQQLEKQLERVMAERQLELSRSLDPALEGSPISRFLNTLSQELKGSSTALDEKLSKALSALDGNNENSLISKLGRDTRAAQESVLKAMNPAATDSPLALLSASLRKSIEELSENQTSLLEGQRERQKVFELDVMKSLERIEHRRESDAKNTRGGFEFEEEVARQAEIVTHGMPVMVSRTGGNSGSMTQRKVGDVVIEFNCESAFSGCSVVIEAKRASNYTVDKALGEIKLARENREAGLGIFVMSRAHAHENFPVLARVGNDVLVQWDMEDPGTDAYLKAALMLALGLVARSRKPVEQGKIDALADIEGRLTREIERLAKSRGFTETIRKNADKIDNELRVSGNKLEKLLENSKSTLRALGVDAVLVSLEDEETIGFSGEHLETANAPDQSGIDHVATLQHLVEIDDMRTANQMACELIDDTGSAFGETDLSPAANEETAIVNSVAGSLLGLARGRR